MYFSKMFSTKCDTELDTNLVHLAYAFVFYLYYYGEGQLHYMGSRGFILYVKIPTQVVLDTFLCDPYPHKDSFYDCFMSISRRQFIKSNPKDWEPTFSQIMIFVKLKKARYLAKMVTESK